MKELTRIHITLKVRSVEEERLYYNNLFDCEPNRIADDQFDWIFDDPPVHFSIYSHQYCYGMPQAGINLPTAKREILKTKLRTVEAQNGHSEAFQIQIYTVTN